MTVLVELGGWRKYSTHLAVMGDPSFGNEASVGENRVLLMTCISSLAVPEGVCTHTKLIGGVNPQRFYVLHLPVCIACTLQLHDADGND